MLAPMHSRAKSGELAHVAAGHSRALRPTRASSVKCAIRCEADFEKWLLAMLERERAVLGKEREADDCMVWR